MSATDRRPSRWAVATSVALAVLCGYAGGPLALEITATAPRPEWWWPWRTG